MGSRTGGIIAVVLAMLLAGGLAACGGSSSSNGNAAKIEAAESEAAAAESEAREAAVVERELEAKLHTYKEPTGGNSPWFRAGPGECTLNRVYVGEEAGHQEDNSQAVVSPDGDVAVVTVPVIEVNGPDSSQADCLKAVVDAMGWGE